MLKENCFMSNDKTTFALFLGNRGFFPASLMDEAREEVPRVLKELGHDSLILDREATRHGAIETPKEGEIYANFLRENRGKFGGVILSLPNFGDETGAIAALKDAGVPILVQAYPDEMDKMAPELRRDAFCGKFSIMDVFCQYGLKFTALKPHTVHPSSERFKANVDYFDRVCRVVQGLKGMVVGAIGARTTAFKTVRIDEIALQRFDITMETLDLSEVFDRMGKVDAEGTGYRDKGAQLDAAASWETVPDDARDKIIRLGVVLDEIIEEYGMDAFALRCWVEMQSQLGISPCILLGVLNDLGIPAACEVDVGNALTMYALRLASGEPTACLDWNNNYEDDDDKCILFHCGPVPPSLMASKGQVADHDILANAVGKGRGFGCNVGRIAPNPFTFGSMVTESGMPKFYFGKGTFTSDQVPADFFGCAGVAHIEHLQDVLLHVGKNGYRHHVSVTPGSVDEPMREALAHYLGFEVAMPQEDV
jgi:L-fucose isomerase-like protein